MDEEGKKEEEVVESSETNTAPLHIDPQHVKTAEMPAVIAFSATAETEENTPTTTTTTHSSPSTSKCAKPTDGNRENALLDALIKVEFFIGCRERLL